MTPIEAPDFESVTTPCVESSGRRHGYREVYLNGRRTYAHRAAWIEAKGPIPKGMHVLHRCDNPACVRIDHLSLGSNRDNVSDKVLKGRQRGGGATGARNPKTKLSDSQVKLLLAMRARGMLLREIAKVFGISTSGVSKITTGRNWRCAHGRQVV